MNHKLPLLAVSLLTLALFPARAQVVETYTFANLDRPIPDGNASGLSDTRILPSSIVSISSVRVRLNVSGEFNGDLYAYLTHDSGFCVLLNRPGKTAANPFGYADAGFDVLFDDAAPGDIHIYQNSVVPPPGSPLTGTWQPDARTIDPANVVTGSSRTAFLNAFHGLRGDGEWTLFVADLESGGKHTLNGWELEISGLALPVITWNNPNPVVYGTALSASQLNAVANVPGSFAYDPPAGTVLNAGPSQLLTAVFTPADSTQYELTIQTVLITVNPAPLVITAQDRTKVYGAALPALAAGYSGFVNGDAASNLTTPVSLSTLATASSPVGSHPITASGATSPNYAITHVNGTLTITPASATGSLTVSQNPVPPGQSVAMSLQLNAVPPGAGTPTGTVQFEVNGSPFGTPQTVVNGVATLNTTTLPVGTHNVAASYTGDGNFLGTSAALAQTLVINTPPVAGPDTIERYVGAGAKATIAELLANDMDADGHELTLVSIDSTSAAGGIITLNGVWVHYTPPAGFHATDTFSYVIRDPLGAEAVGLVTVVIQDDPSAGQNIWVENLGDGSFRLRMYGIPQRTYRLEYTVDLANPTWTPLTSFTIGSLGVHEIINTPPPGSPSRYYRTVYEP